MITKIDLEKKVAELMEKNKKTRQPKCAYFHNIGIEFINFLEDRISSEARKHIMCFADLLDHKMDEETLDVEFKKLENI